MLRPGATRMVMTLLNALVPAQHCVKPSLIPEDHRDQSSSTVTSGLPLPKHVQSHA